MSEYVLSPEAVAAARAAAMRAPLPSPEQVDLLLRLGCPVVRMADDGANEEARAKMTPDGG